MDFSLAKAYFHISPEGADHPEVSMDAAELLIPERMQEMIEIGGRLVRATKPALTASFIGLSVFGLCSTIQLFLAQYNRLLDLSLDNLTFQMSNQEYASVSYKIKEPRWIDVPETGQQREDFLIRELTAYYQQTVNPFIKAIAAAAGVKPELIWNQFGARNVYMQEYILKMETRPEVLARFNHDYELQTELLGAEVFNLRRNPFYHIPRYIESPYKLGEQIMMRSSCCMYYCQEDGQMCYTCPRLTSGERNEMKEKIMAAAK